MERHLVRSAIFLVALIASCVHAFARAQVIAPIPNGFEVGHAYGSVEITAVAEGVVRVDIHPGGVRDTPTPVLNPLFTSRAITGLRVKSRGASASLSTSLFSLTWTVEPHDSLVIRDARGRAILSAINIVVEASKHELQLHRYQSDPLYGMVGLERGVENGKLARPDGAEVKAGSQGNGGAPMFFTRDYGVLIDSIDGAFVPLGSNIFFTGVSRQELEFFVMVGDPLHTIQSIADLTGHIPLPPRWTLGLLNSQWGIDQAELRAVVAKYRATSTPLDGFILDFDWKAWGENDYGEWRWNSTDGPGNTAPDKFPDGADGTLARELAQEGVHLAGILKPRIILFTSHSATTLQEAAAYAENHQFWYPGEPSTIDYVTHRPARDLDFNLPAERAWFWQHLQPAFDAGMQAWWNDEADETTLADKSIFNFDSLQFFDMGRALYDGQRSMSNVRVWSLNRNFYLGAQRFGYTEWSGDIKSNEATMGEQTARMLSTLDLGEPQWSMDTGGFDGNPSPELYARWMEFASYTPIFRVHGNHGEKRQPWIYGPVAEAAAGKAIRRRYELLPYIYAGERTAHETGIGLVRPLMWIFPEDAQAAIQTTEWMFGDALLVAPVLQLGVSERNIYLPRGQWFDYSSGTSYKGRRIISVSVDGVRWDDVPVFVRSGSIIATEVSGENTDAMRPKQIVLDIFPSQQHLATFTFYDDDGISYNYEHGVYYRQVITASSTAAGTEIHIAAPTGTFQTSVRTYLLRVHGDKVPHTVCFNDHFISQQENVDSTAGSNPHWATAKDRFGLVTTIPIDAISASTLMLSTSTSPANSHPWPRIHQQNPPGY